MLVECAPEWDTPNNPANVSPAPASIAVISPIDTTNTTAEPIPATRHGIWPASRRPCWRAVLTTSPNGGDAAPA